MTKRPRNKIRFGSLPTLVLLSLILLMGTTEPTPAFTAKKVVILDLPRFDLAEISPVYPSFYKLMGQSAIGLMPFNVATSLSPQRTYLYFNSGVVLKSPLNGCEIFNGRESVRTAQTNWGTQFTQYGTAALVYEIRTGNRISASKAVNPGISLLLNANNDLNGSFADFLGRIVHQYSIKTAAIGNSDADKPDRASAAIVMDEKGQIDWGAVGTETLLQDPEVPFGIRSNPDQLIQYYRNFRKRAELIVVTLGDLARVEKFKNYLSAERKDYFRKLALRRYDQFLSRLMREVDFDSTQLILLTCLPPDKSQTPDVGLTPILLRGPGFHSGVLSSSTTRKAGIITYNDLRTFIINYLNPKVSLRTKGGLSTFRGKWQDIRTEQTKLIQNYTIRWPLLTVYAILLITAILMIVFALITQFRKRVLRILCLVYMFLLTIPATFLLEALVDPISWFPVILLTLGISGTIFLISYHMSNGDLAQILSWNALITVVVILVDGIFNGYGEMKSFFGYSAVSGARFYGIGNEYLGVLLGAVIVLISLNFKKVIHWPRSLLWMVIGSLSLILFHPSFGAKVGGGLTTLIGLGIALNLWNQRPIHLKDIGRVIGIAVFVLCIMGAFDYYANYYHMTHLGQLVSGVKERGFGVLLAIATRKLQLNWSLIQNNPASFLLIAILIIVPPLYKYRPAGIKDFVTQYPAIAAGFTGLCISALVALVLNDTGIAAAATMFMYGVIMLLLPLIKEQLNPVPEA